MRFDKAKKLGTVVALVAILGTSLIARHFSGGIDASARGQFLRFVPTDATSVIFVDLDELRTSPFLHQFDSWVPRVAEDSDYAQFVRETGFDYERDLGKMFVAFSNHGATSSTLILAEGNFDRNKIEAYLSRTAKAVQQGSLKVYQLPATADGKLFSVALFSSRRIAITDSANLFAALADAVRDAGRAEWQVRFDRLAGSPVFAVVRQDPALQQALSSAAPGRFRSPQLATLLDQMQWISIAAKPDGQLLRLVAEGECPSSAMATQASDFLQGIQLLAQNGLNDPKLRQQMNPEERDAYVELLKSADIQKLDRGDSKSVRLALTVTPRFLTIVKAQNSGSPVNPAADSSAPKKKQVAQTAKHGKNK
jgi:hypothetical protein